MSTPKKMRGLMARIEADTERLTNKIADLPSYGSDCLCDDRDLTFKTIHLGNHFDEIIEYCLDCGGVVT